MFVALFRKAGQVARTRAAMLAVAMVVALGMSSSAWATDPPPLTLPDTGVDMSELITLAVTAMGAIVGAALTAWVAFLVIRKGLSWVRRAV